MLAGIYNITCEQGATFERVFTFYAQDGTTPFDLNGYSARMQIRRDVNAVTTLLDLTTENGRIALGGTEGTIALTLTPAETATLTDDGVYDLEIRTDDAVYRVLKGAFRLDPEVTRIGT